MSKLPHPPPAVEAVRASAPAWTILPGEVTLWRVFPRGGPFPTVWSRFRAWGPSSARFDHHLPGADGQGVDQPRAVLYVADAFETCLAEYFQARRVIDRQRDHTTLVAFTPTRPLRLLNLWDPWSTRVGASGALSTGPHAAARAWSRAMYEAFPDADGLRYESSMRPGSSAMALWERARDALPDAPRFHRALQDPDLWVPVHNAAAHLGYGIL